jgi:2-polyprenyl-3-methyl-5-hydroxy-6-metoxy-1,4-benzoquinol methylase
MDLQAVRRLVEEVNRVGGNYHRWDFGQGLVIPGDYDMTKYLPYYRLPERLDGATVLDVGTASGFFALECTRRGGQVTAIDIGKEKPAMLHGVAQAMGFEIRYLYKSIYDLDASFGQFDLVVCGSLLMHLPDLLGAVRAIRSVCRHQAILSTASTADSATNPSALCEFAGLRATDGDYWHYWNTSAAALRKMALAAGFSRVEWEDHFTLSTEPGRAANYHTPHVVISTLV